MQLMDLHADICSFLRMHAAGCCTFLGSQDQLSNFHALLCIPEENIFNGFAPVAGYILASQAFMEMLV